jgi:hypothetical protein
MCFHRLGDAIPKRTEQVWNFEVTKAQLFEDVVAIVSAVLESDEWDICKVGSLRDDLRFSTVGDP